MTRLLLNILQATLSGSILYILALVTDRFCRRRLSPSARCCLYLPALLRFLCIFTVPIRINKTIYTGPSAAIRTYLPAVFLSENTHVLVVCCLIAVFAALAGKTIWDYRKCMRLIRKSSIDEDNLIRNCSILRYPMTCGITKPCVYLPADLTREEREYALRHEKAHIRRNDLLFRWAAVAAVLVHWFNPLAKGLQARLEHISELACDQAAAADLTKQERARYGHMLLDMFSEQQPLPCLHGLPGNRKNITERIEALTGPAVKTGKRWTGVCALGFLLIVMLGSLLRPEPLTVSAKSLRSDSGERAMMNWLVQAVQDYDLPFDTDEMTLRPLLDAIMEKTDNSDTAHHLMLMYRSEELQGVFQDVLKSGDTTLRGQLACAGLYDYLNWYLMDSSPISQGMAEELFEMIREWRLLQ